MRLLLSSVYPYVFLGLYLTIPFDNYFRALPNILLVILGVTFLLIVKKSDFKKLQRAPAIVLFALLAFLLANSFLNGWFEQDSSYLGKFGLALGLVVLHLPINDFKKINHAIIFSSLAAIIFSAVNVVMLVNISEDIGLSFPRQVIEALLIDRLYLGMLAVFSILISYQSLRGPYHPNNRYHLANIIINIGFILLVLSKLALVVLLLAVIVRQFYSRRWVVRSAVALLATVALALLVIIPLSKPNPLEDQVPKTGFGALMNNTFTWELRRTIWNCASDVIRTEDITLTGHGLAGTKEKLMGCYREGLPAEVRDRYVEGRYNVHNQYLDFYLAAGLVALALFLGFFALAFFKVRRHYLPTAFLVILGGYAFVENIFHRQIGAYYAGLMLIYILISSEFAGNKEHEITDET